MNSGHTVQSCTNLCRNTSGCKKTELGNASGCCNHRCDLYTSTSCNGYGSTHWFIWYHTNNAPFSDKYVLNRGAEGTLLETVSGHNHLSACSKKCMANSVCREFTVKSNSCLLYDKCTYSNTASSTFSDHYKRMDCELVNRCAVDPNTITNPSTNGWSTSQTDSTPTRQETIIQIPDFEYSNADCPWMLYELQDHESDKIKVVDRTLVYNSAHLEPKTLSFTLRVTAMGGTRFQDFPTTLKIEGCDNE